MDHQYNAVSLGLRPSIRQMELFQMHEQSVCTVWTAHSQLLWAGPPGVRQVHVLQGVLKGSEPLQLVHVM